MRGVLLREGGGDLSSPSKRDGGEGVGVGVGVVVEVEAEVEVEDREEDDGEERFVGWGDGE